MLCSSQYVMFLPICYVPPDMLCSSKYVMFLPMCQLTCMPANIDYVFHKMPTPMCYNTLQHTATHCNTLQHTATHSHVLLATSSAARRTRRAQRT